MYNRVLGIHEELIVVSSVSRSGASDEARLSVSIVISVSRSGASDEGQLSVSIAATPSFRNLPMVYRPFGFQIVRHSCC